MPADAVHHKINDLLRLGEALVAEERVRDGKRNDPESAGRVHQVET